MTAHDTVRVKLTPEGKALLLKEHDITHDECVRRGCGFRPTPPSWDKDGWIEGTFWQLMRSFSSCWVLGADVPFTQLEAKES